MQDRFEDLRTFVTVVQSRSFASAARRLGVVKSAVSRRVQELEERLGSHLINRSTRTLSLTETGRAFFEKAVGVLAGLEEAEGVAANGAVEPVGTLRILGPTAFGRVHLVPIICSFMEQHSRLTVELSLSDEFVDLVAEGFDMAVRIGELKDSTLAARRLGDIRRVACASPAYLNRFGTPREPKDLAHHRGLQYSLVEEKSYWRFVDPRTRKEQIVSVSSRLLLNNGDALCSAAIAGAGIAVLPTFIIHKAVVDGALVPVMLPYEKVPTSIHVVYPSRRLMPAKVRAFVDYLAEKCAPYPYWDRDVFGSEKSDAPVLEQ
jgi:DNA-binding transcriptional LysR family regulator